MLQALFIATIVGSTALGITLAYKDFSVSHASGRFLTVQVPANDTAIREGRITGSAVGTSFVFEVPDSYPAGSTARYAVQYDDATTIFDPVAHRAPTSAQTITGLRGRNVKIQLTIKDRAIVARSITAY